MTEHIRDQMETIADLRERINQCLELNETLANTIQSLRGERDYLASELVSAQQKIIKLLENE